MSMDPVKLAASAVTLNLSLMRWRLMPDIDLPRVAKCRCLLLGSGTLGCNVARLLLGWGVQTITFVDNGNVSFSNPVRQTLFTFDDSKQARPKAEAAAARLSEVFPGVHTAGHSLTVPMPGHPISGDAEMAALNAASELERLVLEHDAVFLLMDSREARWLPSVLCAAHNKMCFTGMCMRPLCVLVLCAEHNEMSSLLLRLSLSLSRDGDLNYFRGPVESGVASRASAG
jgi:ubiquitin-like modifier-activating enzyme ATG7